MSRDARQFLAFMAEHLGGAPSLAELAKLTPQDVRAFMAARRGDGICGRSLMRVLAGVRSFARFLERNGKGKVGALAAVRAPKVPKTLPKPLDIAAAKRVSDADLRAGEEREPWILARDAAVLALLYGSGLAHLGGAGPERGDVPAPGRGDAITVTGKGNKQRMVPLLAQVTQLIADYIAICPYDLPADGPLFVGARGGPLSPRIVQLVMERLRGALVCRIRRRRMRCGIPLRRIFWRAAAICAPSRSCSAMRRCRPRRSTRLLTPNACSKSTAAPIPGHDILRRARKSERRGMRDEPRCARGAARGRAQARA